MFQDRTVEFHSIVESLSARSSVIIPAEKNSLLAHNPLSKSDFTKAASAIAKDINSTTSKLSKLALLAKQKSLFDDRPTEINELVHVIKMDISKLNKQIQLLSDYLSRNSSASLNSQSSLHTKHVLVSLQSKLATTSHNFKNVLEIRTENMKDQKNRREQYSSLIPATSTSDSPLYNPQRSSSAIMDDNHPKNDTIVDFSGLQQQTTSINLASMEYMDSRSKAIDSIESTIAELGQIYQNFATLLAGQREMVQRIDENVMDMQVNVEGAHTQLAKFYQGMSGNRALMLKIFAVVIVFFMAFILMS